MADGDAAGTNRPADRFVRASFHINAIPHDEGPDPTAASVFSVIRNVSVPHGIMSSGQPNISSTRWRTGADKNDFIYFFESALTPNTFWVNFGDIDFGDHGKVMKLKLGKDQSNTYAGNAVKYFSDDHAV